jgi:hypothetical protein
VWKDVATERVKLRLKLSEPFSIYCNFVTRTMRHGIQAWHAMNRICKMKQT